MKGIKHTWFFGMYIVLFIYAITFSSLWKINKEYPYQFAYNSDVNQYYCYLPAAFIQGDLSFSFPNNRSYWLIPDENGTALPKMTSGMAILYSPFFLVGHLVASNSQYDADGYSLPYSVSLKIGTYFYVSIGLFLLYLVLLYFFKPWISALTVGSIFIGTNLFYYTLSEGEMSHSYLFWLFAVILINTIKWSNHHKTKNLLFLALALGMSVLIRPTSLIIILVPFFYFWSSGSLSMLFTKQYKQLISAILLFVLPVFIQMIYWKTYGGTWVRWSYGDEHFYFNNPHTWEFLFSYRKGWLVYTPLMFFSLIGFLFLPRYASAFKWTFPLVIGLAVFILSSWWCWWFGGSLGSRAMVEFYALLALPLASFFTWMLTTKWIKYGIIPLIFFTIFFNQFAQYKKNFWQLHWDSMTKESFWFTFSSFELVEEEKKHLETLYKTPDYENARIGLDERH